MNNKDWQEVSLAFFKELTKEYFSKNPAEQYRDTVIEVYDPTGNRRYFIDNISRGSDGFKVYEKYFEEGNPISMFFKIPEFFNDLLGFVAILSRNNPIIELGKHILKTLDDPEYQDFANEVDAEFLKEVREDMKNYTPGAVYPMVGSMPEIFFLEHLIISVPPGEVDPSGHRNDPLWYKKTGKTEITLDNLEKSDWSLKDNEKFVKIRSWSYEEYKEIEREGRN